MHRDQTNLSMIQRMKKNGGTSTGHQSRHTVLPITFVHERFQSPTFSVSFSLEDTPSPSPQLAPALPLTERATCHFASNFILIPHKTDNPRGFLCYLIPLMKSEPHDSPVRFAFNACSLALLSNREKADGVNLSNLSLEAHTLALARTHAALRNPATANLDSTLVTVLLLTLFESITAVKESQMLTWRTHLQGAINIVKSRGREELRRTKFGAILFNAVRQQLIARILSEGTGPPMGTDWWMYGADIDLGSPMAAACQRLALRTAELRAEVSQTMDSTPRTPESRDEMSRLMQVVKSVQCDAATILQRIPPELRSKTLCYIQDTDAEFLQSGGDYSKSEIYPGRIDVYPNLMVAVLWNLIRVARLILASVEIRIAAWLSFPMDYHETPEYMTSKQVCQDLVADIISSVPCLLGWRNGTHTHMFDTNAALASGYACGLDGPTKALPALFLSWQLISVKNHDFCQPTQREWVSGRLKFIEQKAGLKYAGLINEVGWTPSPQFT